MGDIVFLRSAGTPKKNLHLAGTAKCLACGTEWQAVAPVGTTHLECPKCRTKMGVVKYPFGAGDGEAEWQCNCGCNVFRIVADEHHKFKAVMCLRCGTPQQF